MSEQARVDRRRPRGRFAVFAVVAGSLGFATLLVLVTISWSPLADVDAMVAQDMYVTMAVRPTLVDVLVVVDRAFDPWVLRAVGLVVAGMLYSHRERRLALWLGGTVVASALAAWFVKALIGRPRPVFAEPLAVRDGFAFPSGHALTSALIAGAAVILVLALGAARRRLVVTVVLATVVVLVVGADRIVLAVHQVSDVLAGWLFAAALLGGSTIAFGVHPGLARARRNNDDPARPRRLGVVLNPSKVEDHSTFRQQLERLAAQHGWDRPMWFETTVTDAGHAMTRAALAAGVDLVIAAGGDGTVRVVCAELASTGVPVGIVATGTGNLLARNLGLPLDPSTAIRVALTGDDRTIDLVRVVGDRIPPDRFVVMAGLGLDAAVVGEAPAKLKARMGWPAYLVSMARNLSFPAVRVDLSVDDEPPVRRWARTVLVGNVGTLHAGLSLLPDAAPDDGLLDVVLVAPRRLTDWPGLAWRVVRRSASQDDRLRTWRGRKVVVRAVDACPRQLDGDVVEVGHELRCEIDPGVLVVRVPSS